MFNLHVDVMHISLLIKRTELISVSLPFGPMNAAIAAVYDFIDYTIKLIGTNAW
jgi:hypothetical protein